jgi:hypothetical protein
LCKLALLIIDANSSQSNEKSREVLLETSITRTRKFGSLRFESVHAIPQLSAGPPRTYVAVLVVNVGVDFAVVHDAPPSHDNCTQIFGAPLVLSAFASSLTSIP